MDLPPISQQRPASRDRNRLLITALDTRAVSQYPVAGLPGNDPDTGAKPARYSERQGFTGTGQNGQRQNGCIC